MVIGAHRSNLKRYGLTDEDLDTDSDRFVKTVGVYGSVDTIAERICGASGGERRSRPAFPFGTLAAAVDQLEKLQPALAARTQKSSATGA